MTQNIYFESRNESLAGQFAVASVTMNRVDSEYFPDSVCNVVWQEKQFSWTHDGKKDRPLENKIEQRAWKEIKVISFILIKSWSLVKWFDMTDGALFYHSKKVYPNWAMHYNESVRIGNHIFYQM